MINGKYSKNYAMYKGEKFIDIGTLLQLAKIKNVSLKTMRFYVSPTYRKRRKNSKNAIVLVEV